MSGHFQGAAGVSNASKPALEYLNMTSIKSSIKTDQISNTMSTDCLNAQKIGPSRNQAKPNIHLIPSQVSDEALNTNDPNFRAKFNFSQQQVKNRNNANQVQS